VQSIAEARAEPDEKSSRRWSRQYKNFIKIVSDGRAAAGQSKPATIPGTYTGRHDRSFDAGRETAIWIFYPEP
jgi:hypothetical protein